MGHKTVAMLTMKLDVVGDFEHAVIELAFMFINIFRRGLWVWKNSDSATIQMGKSLFSYRHNSHAKIKQWAGIIAS